MNPLSIIKPMRDKHHHQDARISAIEGRRYVRRPTYFKNVKNGEEYYSIVGSIAFPIGKTPGFAVIVGVLKEPWYEKVPRLKVLAEIEELTLEGLLTQSKQIRHRWGYPHQLDLWIGDAEHFLQALSDFNDRIETKPLYTSDGLYLSPPSDFEDTRRDAIYLQTVKSLLNSAIGSGKRLLIGDNRLLRAHLQNVPPNIKKIEEIPALAALAYACHTLLATTPWLQYTQPERFDPTIKDGFVRVDVWPGIDDIDEPFMWNDSQEDFNYDDANHDDESLVSTVD